MLLGLALLGAFGIATLLGADRARRPLDARSLADETLSRALDAGSEAPEVREAVVRLRRAVGRSPLDTRARVSYAGLLLGLCRRVDDTRAPAFHAARAAELSPVTVPVVRSAVRVLARTGEVDRAIGLVYDMFAYDAESAAGLLYGLEPFLPPQAIDEAVGERQQAWLAWMKQLRSSGRTDEADAWLMRAHERWPDNLVLLRRLARKAVAREDWTALARLFPADLELPDERQAAPVLACRARMKAEQGDRAGAAADAARAVELDGQQPTTLTLAGDAYRALGEHARARQIWQRALHRLPPGASGARRWLLVRLAAVEELHGEPAAALRLWREVLEISPDDPLATQHVEQLTGLR